ncbi:hypothetical protein HYR53_07750 [Candidatus Acetothermia bacterium]|nr:hypothetical protein [Candidatus Acetothermia bacterium]
MEKPNQDVDAVEQMAGSKEKTAALNITIEVDRVIIFGYVMALVPLFILPISLITVGVGIGAYNYIRGKELHRIVQMILAAVVGMIGSILEEPGCICQDEILS